MKPRLSAKKFKEPKFASLARPTLTNVQPLAEARLQRWLSQLIKSSLRSRILSLVKPSMTLDCQVEIISSPRMLKLNHLYRKIKKPTDVLSFEAPPVFLRAGFLGQLYICLPVLTRQAKEHGHPLQQELDILLVHGLLHLVGFDHERGDKAAVEMAFAESLFIKKRKGLIRRGDLGTE
jgi:probable rRNA maturation factor